MCQNWEDSKWEKIVKSMQLLDKKVRVILSYATGKLRLLGVFRLITGDARLM